MVARPYRRQILQAALSAPLMLSLPALAARGRWRAIAANAEAMSHHGLRVVAIAKAAGIDPDGWIFSAIRGEDGPGFRIRFGEGRWLGAYDWAENIEVSLRGVRRWRLRP
jgi:hypothetical protein